MQPTAINPPAANAPDNSVAAQLAPLMTVVLVAFVVIGMALPVLPLHVHDGLGFGAAVVGLVTGSQFAASLFSRVWAGRTCDVQGAKRAVTFGLLAAAAAGALYLISTWVSGAPIVSVAILLGGRALLGGAESFIITGATIWGLARAGAGNAGKVIAWMGTAMFAAFAAGAPLGVALYNRWGFAAVAAATAVAPLATLAAVLPVRRVAPLGKPTASIVTVVRKVWLPGLGAALSSVGFGAMLSFSSLLYSGNGWTPVWLPFTAYALALVAARLLFGHLPDRIGGAKVSLVCALIETAGLLLMWNATSAIPATIGAGLVGFGYALVFPGLGVEAVRRAPPESRGLAMGAYTACLDLALGSSGPALGLIASGFGFSSVFLVSATVVLASTGVAFALVQRPTREK